MAERRFLAEWEPQSAILIAWPHIDSDWASILSEVIDCYRHFTQAIVADEPLIIVTPDANVTLHDLEGIDKSRITIVELPTNDTWARDFGPLAVQKDGITTLLDFTFNAWGLKFAADKDNLVTSRLATMGIIGHELECHRDMVLEGGSVETDGHGTLLTTSQCLLSPNRNAQWTRSQVEQQLINRFGVSKVLWLEHGSVPGDDTDSHIDTLARLAPHRTIIHATAQPGSKEFDEIQMMINQLREFTDSDGQKFCLKPLPALDPIFDDEGNRLPATYANYLITNHSVLVPTYAQPENDSLALEVISRVFPDRRVKGIDCRALIQQHGSLHCATMQLYS